MRSIDLLLPFAVLAVSGCREDRRAPAPTEPSSSAPVPFASATLPAPCMHRRPFSDSDKPLVLPAPFDVFTPCDLVAVLPGHDGAAQPGLRIDRVRRWDVHGRVLLAALYYRGEDAEAKILCNACRVAVHLAVVERRGASVALVGGSNDPWQPRPEAGAPFNGRADFDVERPFDETESMLGVKTPWSMGDPGTWTNSTLYRFVGDEVKIVFEYGVDWAANGNASEDDDRVVSAIAVQPRPGAANDLVLNTTEVRCHDDYGALEPTPVCRPPQKVGAERWRFEATAYRRIEGKAAPLPRVLHKLWGWQSRTP